MSVEMFHDVLVKKETGLDYKNADFSEGQKSHFSEGS